MKTRGAEEREREKDAERKGWRTREENDSFYHYATRSRVYFLPFFKRVCVYVPQRRVFAYSDADRLPHRQVETESYVERRKGEAWLRRGRGSRMHVGLRKS